MIPTLAIILLLTTLPLLVIRLYQGDLRLLPLTWISFFLLYSILVTFEITSYSFAKVWSSNGVLIHSQMNLLYFIFIIVILFVSKPKILFSNFKIDLRQIYLLKTYNVYIFSLSFIMLGFAIIHIINVKIYDLYYFNRYLFMNSSEILRSTGDIHLFLHENRRFFGVLSFFILSIAIITKSRVTILIILAPCLWYLLLNIASHSRQAALLLSIAALVLFFGGRKWLSVSFILLAALTFFSALVNRNLGEHGFSQVTSSMINAITSNSLSLEELIGNFFEGVYNQAESGFYLDYYFPNFYKVLSFSPLPSFIDGFADHGLNYSLRYHPVVPVGATSEVLIFGWQYFIFYWAVIAFAHRQVLNVLERNPAVGMILLVLFMYALHVQFAYPTRWVFRPFLLCAIASLIYLNYSRVSRR